MIDPSELATLRSAVRILMDRNEGNPSRPVIQMLPADLLDGVLAEVPVRMVARSIAEAFG